MPVLNERYIIYILTNQRHTVLYVGMTSDIAQRLRQHKQKHFEGFTKRYHVNKLVYVESYGTASEAIVREKQLKAGSRQRKLDLINAQNPTWRDLSDDFLP